MSAPWHGIHETHCCHHCTFAGLFAIGMSIELKDFLSQVEEDRVYGFKLNVCESCDP
jgi:hypothetical protein